MSTQRRRSPSPCGAYGACVSSAPLPPSGPAAPRVRLGAIAKDEGAHLLDWVFHHLHLGFDGIVVWVNGTSDPSVEILEAIAAVDPRVKVKVADALLAESLDAGRNFQHRAYRRMAKRSRAAGFTHLAFLDVDEYWTPRDLTSSIHDFLDPAASVVSFPWALDVPHAAQAPFLTPFDVRPGLQLDRHVKSVVSLDDRLDLVLTHTARTHAGDRRWVREPFPLEDEQAQHSGSLVPRPWLAGREHELPEAFVVHAMHRSPLEYVASLARGGDQTGRRMAVKDNRHGYVASPAPVLEFPHAPEQVERYLRLRAEFRAAVGVEPLVEESRRQVGARRDDLVARAVTDPDLLQLLRTPLHGLAVPELDAAHPGWDTTLQWRLEVATPAGADSPAQVSGWAFDQDGAEVELGLRDGGGRLWEGLEFTRQLRPDVPLVLPAAPQDAGFVLTLPAEAADLTHARVLARTVGAREWEPLPLPALPVPVPTPEPASEPASETASAAVSSEPARRPWWRRGPRPGHGAG